MATRLCLMVFGVLLAQPVLAGPREEVFTAMQRCGAIQDDRVWLDCTYGAQQIMRARLGLPPAPEYQQRLVPPASALYAAPAFARPGPPLPQPGAATASQPAAPRRGSFLQVLAGTAPPVTVSNLNAIAYDAQGGFIATLDNGEVWHQANADGTRARLRIGAKITVTPGAMWSYTLTAGDNPHAYKVERRP